MQSYRLAALLKIELPDHTVLYCDGGTIDWDSDTYTSRDDWFGVIEEVETVSEAAGNAMPTFTLTWLVPDEAVVPASDLNRADYQNCRLQMWSAEVDEDGLISGDPDPEADMIIDVPTLRFDDQGRRVLDMSCVSAWQRLFDFNEGNGLSSAAHNRIYPDEQGLDNVNGVATDVAWGEKGVRGIRGGLDWSAVFRSVKPR